VDRTAELTDFAETAALIENLDLVVTVDTAVAHRAGAMGKKTFTIVPFLSDFRWFLNRDDSPWYPTMRLFRLRSMYGWEKAVREVGEALRTFVTGKR
jgi:ADP-heptose:LPS heptosyltransferase